MDVVSICLLRNYGLLYGENYDCFTLSLNYVLHQDRLNDICMLLVYMFVSICDYFMLAT